MSIDPEEDAMEEAERRADPRRIGDVLERIEWRLQYGEIGGLASIKTALWIIVVLLAILVFR